MGRLRLALAAVVIVCAPLAARAEGDPVRQKAAMDAIAGLLGTWTGVGWRNPPDGGPRYQYQQTYVVAAKAGGLVFTMEGAGSRRVMANPPAPGPGSFAVITYDVAAGRYTLRSFSRGDYVVTYGELLRPGVFRWEATFQGARLRFTVDTSGGAWIETGERSVDGGKTWTANYGVDLARAAP